VGGSARATFSTTKKTSERADAPPTREGGKTVTAAFYNVYPSKFFFLSGRRIEPRGFRPSNPRSFPFFPWQTLEAPPALILKPPNRRKKTKTVGGVCSRPFVHRESPHHHQVISQRTSLPTTTGKFVTFFSKKIKVFFGRRGTSSPGSYQKLTTTFFASRNFRSRLRTRL
jgi:hypothetical protein